MLAVAVVVSAVIVVAWFPASDLLHQRQQLAAASTHLERVRQENDALAGEAKRLQSPSEVGRIAQQQYGLVAAGQQAYQVLPPSSSGSTSALSTGTTSSGTTQEGSSSDGSASAAKPHTTAGSGSFFGRVLRTLEFWK